MEDSSFAEDVKKHTFKFMIASYDAMNELSKPKTLIVEEPRDALISNCKMQLTKGKTKQVFEYSIQLSEYVPIKDFEKANFGFASALTLKSGEEQLFLNHKSIVSMTRTMKDEYTLFGEIDNINSLPINEIRNHHLRLIVPVEKNAPTTLLQGTSYTDKTTIYGYGLASVVIHGITYDVYRHEDKKAKQHYLIVESRTRLDYHTFTKTSNAILKAFSLLCGNWYGDQRYILSSDDESFERINSIHFEMASYSIITEFKIIDSFQFVNYMEALSGTRPKVSENSFPVEVLANMATKIMEEPSLERSLSLILEGNQTKSNILRSCSYLVAIETLSSLISKVHQDYFKTIKKPSTFSAFQSKLKEVLAGFSAQFTVEENKVVNKKIENFNSPTNIDKIIKSFELFGIQLPADMVEIIKSRNIFLHGQAPFKERDAREQEYQIAVNALKMHFLASTLFLKFCGYKGHIKNLAGAKVYQDKKHDPSFVLTDHVFYTI